VTQPKIVLADEQTAALDKKSGREVVELMQKLAKEQRCNTLLVTHDNRILDIADQIVYGSIGESEFQMPFSINGWIHQTFTI
jgi:putative ABC transport system ATP-binding protein